MATFGDMARESPSLLAHFARVMGERRKYRGQQTGPDWQYRTRAARKYAWMILRVPTQEWTEK